MSTDNGDLDDEEQEEQHDGLSTHTQSMREALNYCLEKAKWTDGASDHEDERSAAAPPLLLSATDRTRIMKALQESSLESLETKRKACWKDFWSRGKPMTVRHDDILVRDEATQDTAEHDEADSSTALLLYAPCLIHGCAEQEFQQVTSAWVRNNSSINKDWFREHVGDDTEVPVRRSNNTDNLLDDHGRATECSTTYMTMREWIEGDKNNDYYLKDWHLQKILEDRDSKQSLYQTPTIFPFDLLNDFLLRFTNGDYRFVYWGPKNSTTLLHSDVLHSFSWSYNVVGCKQWTFYNDDDESSTTFLQQSQELLFVPSTWKHSVVNLQETLSINHNWITTHNIDLCWDCIYSELEEVESEYDKWNHSDSNNEACFEAKENMLRGCVGLDVTAFVLMCLVRLVDLLVEEAPADEERLWFDVFRIHTTLKTVLEEPSVCVRERMSAVLGSRYLGNRVMSLLSRVLGALDEFIGPIIDPAS